MSLKAAVEASGTVRTRCGIVPATEALSKKDQVALAEMLADHAYTAAQISRGLLSIGVTCSAQTVRRHRTGVCTCGAV